MNARIQTWFPFRIQICLNGREWLARQMDQAGLRYVRQDNCFPWIEDFAEAQRLMDQQLSTHWAEELNGIAAMLNPIHEEIFQHFHVNYYWSTHQSESAIDIRFPQAEDLKRLYPLLLQPRYDNLWESGCAPLSRQASALGRTSAAILDRKSTRLNSSHLGISYAVFCLN